MFSSRKPSKRQIAEQNEYLLKRQQDFYEAARYVTCELSKIPEVRKIALFGSVASPLEIEVPRFNEYRKHNIAVYHECKDVDLAVWVDKVTSFEPFRLAVVNALKRLFTEKNLGVAIHQVDVFLIEPETNRYLGRLCDFGTCPKGKRECLAPGCGDVPFLQQHEGFILYPEALEPSHITLLYERT